MLTQSIKIKYTIVRLYDRFGTISVVKKVVSVVMEGRQNVVKCLQYGRQKVFRCLHLGRQKVFKCRHLGRHNVVRSSRGSMQGRHLGRKLIEKL